MTDSTNTEATEISLEIENDNLDEFNDLFLGKAKPEEVKEEKSEQKIQDQSEDDTETLEAQKEDDNEEDAKEETPEQKPKSRFQERISELTRAKKEAEAREAAALAELQALKAGKKTEDPVEQKTQTKVDDSPKADDTNEDGSEKYPLGEFDPTFIRDLTRYTIRKEQEAEAIRQEELGKIQKEEASAKALQDQWQEKLNTTVKEKPDFVEKAEELETTFRDLDPSYGNYLAETIMSMEAGPEVLYYLANNIEEAKEIADLGAVKATIALGHLEAALTTKNETIQRKTVKVSKAPEPPSSFAKGTKGHTEVVPDTDNLDDFSHLFFKKK